VRALPVPELVAQVEPAVREEVAIVKELEAVASKHPYYKYNSKWSRAVQGAIGTTVYCAWLGGFPDADAAAAAQQPSGERELGRLLTLEQVGAIFQGTTLHHRSLLTPLRPNTPPPPFQTQDAKSRRTEK